MPLHCNNLHVLTWLDHLLLSERVQRWPWSVDRLHIGTPPLHALCCGSNGSPLTKIAAHSFVSCAPVKAMASPGHGGRHPKSLRIPTVSGCLQHLASAQPHAQRMCCLEGLACRPLGLQYSACCACVSTSVRLFAFRECQRARVQNGRPVESARNGTIP